MKNLLNTLFVLILSTYAYGQKMPTIKVGEEKLGITSLDVEVEVVGNIATTTYDMLFYNPTNSILEGELAFPLGERQNVSRLALEVNGKLREAVVVEKEQGRIAFEAVVRRGVDPILLEKGTGNNYKARIYPILAKKYKRVVLAYEQELIYNEGSHYFHLPIGFKTSLDHFSLEMNVYGQEIKPSLSQGDLETFKFNRISQSYYAKFEKENFTPNKNLVIKIPQSHNSSKIITSDDYFFVYKAIKQNKRLRQKPKAITMYWDASLSMQNRDLEKELAFLETYLSYLSDVKLELVVFSNDIISRSNFRIKKGGFKNLKQELIQTIYDGGTSFSKLFFDNNCDEILVFSDGMKNLSDILLQTEKPIFVVNSIAKSNHSELKSICNATNGMYINLITKTVTAGIEAIKYQPYKFFGVKSKNRLLEVYPKPGVTVSNDFSIAGKNFNRGDSISLLFGYGKEVVSELTFEITDDIQNKFTSRIWAQKKLTNLQEENEINKEEIIRHSKLYNLVSNHTSLIVLETVWDYVKYKIEPPEELHEEYSRIIERMNNAKVVSTNNSEKEDNSIVNIETDNSSNNNIQGNISGTIADENGLPLPGVNVIVRGTTNGTQTDFDGNYSINAQSGNVLSFSFLGYQTLETTVSNSSNISFSMKVDSDALEEVVITAFGISRKKDEVTYAYQEVKSEELSYTSNPDIVNSLAGKVSGLSVNQNKNDLNQSSTISLRGITSLSGNYSPLIVIDGVVSENAINALDPNIIESINVIKGASGSALYGSRALNGVIVVTTKYSYSRHRNYSSTRNQRRKNHIYRGRLKIHNNHSDLKYIKELNKSKSLKEAYAIYLNQREEYSNVPAYYIDVFDYFKKWKNTEICLRILTNIAEMDFDNYELLRVLAYKLEEINNYGLASYIYSQVLKLRPEDSQSYRDLALAYQEIGMSQESFNLLNSIINGSIYKKEGRRKFLGMKNISKNEINKLLQNEQRINKDGFSKIEEKKTDFDLRIVIDWNHNDTDIDLHVIDPFLEECSYKNPKTTIGGEISQDMTQGFGPEEFTLRHAKEGAYYVKINYYGDRYQKIENPTFMKVTIYRNFGKPDETKEIKVVRLTKRKDNQIVAMIEV